MVDTESQAAADHAYRERFLRVKYSIPFEQSIEPLVGEDDVVDVVQIIEEELQSEQ